MSLVIRLELSAPGNQILGGNNQLFNVLVTAHAILMVFFLIMPVTMGFFGKKVNKYLYIKRNILTENKNEKKLNNYENLGHYLAGLIEGDGTILVQEDVDITLNRKYNPMISIAFHKKDKELAEYLCKELKIGKVYEKKGNYVL
jgi:heme/copper-type cytochrome/quinol oxidase subunit 1